MEHIVSRKWNTTIVRSYKLHTLLLNRLLVEVIPIDERGNGDSEGFTIEK